MLAFFGNSATSNNVVFTPPTSNEQFMGDSDTVVLPFKAQPQNHSTTPTNTINPLFLKDPANMETKVEYDPANKQYNISKKVGKYDAANPSYMNDGEFKEYDLNQVMRKEWHDRMKSESNTKQSSGFKLPFLDKQEGIFGSDLILSNTNQSHSCHNSIISALRLLK